MLDLAVDEVGQVKLAAHVILHLALVLLGHDAADCALHRSGDVVDVLGLDHRAEFVLENLGEVILKLRAAKVLEDLGPLGGVVETPEVGLELPSKFSGPCSCRYRWCQRAPAPGPVAAWAGGDLNSSARPDGSSSSSGSWAG